MRELLQQALAEVKAARELVYEKTGLVEFNKPLGLESAIEAALSRSKWHKIADGLPVVPEGQYWAKFWAADKRGNIHKIRILAAYSTATIEHDFRGYTHYMYRQDDTPAPPEEA